MSSGQSNNLSSFVAFLWPSLFPLTHRLQTNDYPDSFPIVLHVPTISTQFSLFTRDPVTRWNLFLGVFSQK